jgi:hypothetical protein
VYLVREPKAGAWPPLTVAKIVLPRAPQSIDPPPPVGDPKTAKAAALQEASEFGMIGLLSANAGQIPDGFERGDGRVTVEGGLDATAVATAMVASSKDCKASDAGIGVFGNPFGGKTRRTLRFTIGWGGSVEYAGTLGAGEGASCWLDGVRAAKFPAPTGWPAVVTFEYAD